MYVHDHVVVVQENKIEKQDFLHIYDNTCVCICFCFKACDKHFSMFGFRGIFTLENTFLSCQRSKIARRRYASERMRWRSERSRHGRSRASSIPKSGRQVLECPERHLCWFSVCRNLAAVLMTGSHCSPYQCCLWPLDAVVRTPIRPTSV